MNSSVFKTQIAPTLFLLVFVAAIVGCATPKREQAGTALEKAGGLNQPENLYLAGLVIFPETNPAISKHLGREVDPRWTPSTNIVIEAINQLPSYLLSTNKGPLAYPQYTEKCLPAKQYLPKSICQVVGLTFEGRKGILLNFLPADQASRFETNWRERFIKVYDGGPRWWSVIYLKEEKAFTALHFDLGY
ncbi:MAG: hypothetical protein QM813_10110 [Verrucomicrobiota bacterium]